jgi:hypothetical protein
MTKITAKVLVASSDKEYPLPAAGDLKPVSDRPPQARAPALPSTPYTRSSENDPSTHSG